MNKQERGLEEVLIGMTGFFSLAMLTTANWLYRESLLYPKSGKGGVSSRLAAVSIISSYMAIEAYTNEVAQEKLEEIEKELASEPKELKQLFLLWKRKFLRDPKLVDKLGQLTTILTGKKFPKNDKEFPKEQRDVWDGFIKLKEKREGLTHYELKRITEEQAKKFAEALGIQYPGKSELETHLRSTTGGELQINYLMTVTPDEAKNAIKTSLKMIAEINRTYHGCDASFLWVDVFKDSLDLTEDEIDFLTKIPERGGHTK